MLFLFKEVNDIIKQTIIDFFKHLKTIKYNNSKIERFKEMTDGITFNGQPAKIAIVNGSDYGTLVQNIYSQFANKEVLNISYSCSGDGDPSAMVVYYDEQNDL